MQRSCFMASFVLLVALMPLSAQHGGGHASAGGHGGMASHGGFSGHAFSPPHSGASGVHSFSGPASGHSFASRGFNHSGGARIRTYGFGSNCFSYGCRGRYGYPWGYAGVYDPYWWWNSGSSYNQDQQYQTGLANEMNAQSLDEQRMREQSDQDLYASSAPPRPREHKEEVTEPSPPTVLVFRDEHKQEVQNYAIVGQTLWSFAPEHTQKIPLSDLDIAATTKENDERGVDFHVPGAPAGQ